MVELKAPMAAVRTALYLMPDEHENLAILKGVYPRDSEWRAAFLIIDALSIFEDATLLFSSSEYGLAASMFPWTNVLLYAVEENLSGIKEVDALQKKHSVWDRRPYQGIGDLAQGLVLSPAYNVLYKQCNEENFDILKGQLRREMQNITPRHAPIQPAGEKPTTNHTLARAMQRLIDL